MGFAVFIFLVVEVALVFFIVKYRRGRRARDVEGPQIRGHLNLELAWTAVPVLILVAIAIFTFYELPGIKDVPAAGAAGLGAADERRGQAVLLADHVSERRDRDRHDARAGQPPSTRRGDLA